jgi:hypothetical protein
LLIATLIGLAALTPITSLTDSPLPITISLITAAENIPCIDLTLPSSSCVGEGASVLSTRVGLL